VRDVVQQPLYSTRAKLSARHIQWRLAVQERMRPIQKRARFGLLTPQTLGKGNHAREPFGPFTLLNGEPGAALERRRRHDTVDERRNGCAGPDRAARDQLERSFRKTRANDAIEIDPRTDGAAQDRPPAQHLCDAFNIFHETSGIM
jgi:hypothetical protein